jgi:DNA-binding GntR family transcriptional regulator
MILDKRISPKEPLSESGFASMIGMSRTPVREALKRLQNESLVVSSDKKGYFLNIPTLKEIKDLYELRAILEGGAVKLAAQKIDLRRLEDFEKRILSYKNGGSDDNEFDFIKVGKEFHLFIVESTQNKKLEELIKTIYAQLEISRVYAYDQRREEAVDEHLRIARALKERDQERSQDYMEQHLKKSYETLMKIL